MEKSETKSEDHLVFVHIPRTGGKTTRKLAYKAFDKYIHFPNEYEGVDIHASKIFTILRNPKDRYKSEYKTYYEIYKRGGLPKDYRERYENEKITDYKTFVDCKFTHNTQTKMLLGYKLYEKETVTITDADKVIERIKNDEIIPLPFYCLLEIIHEFEQMNPTINKLYFKVKEMPMNQQVEDTTEDTHCNEVDEYLYNTLQTQFPEKIERAKELMKKKILRIIK